jgi:glycyl-tRNA synthetase
MQPLFNANGLMFWTDEEIKLREHFIEHFADRIGYMLWRENQAWRLVRVEAPLLMPVPLLNPNYTSDDVWFQDSREPIENAAVHLVLRPETTAGSYTYAQRLLSTHSGHKPPLCVWQAGKSFRREQDQVIKNMRLKEFWQQEFQCIYAADTMNDYMTAILEPLRSVISMKLGYPLELSRVVESDRLPSYSQITMDIEINNGDKWMEVCSVSRRTDYPEKLVFPGKKGTIEKDALVLEIAIGLDRCLYCERVKNGY